MATFEVEVDGYVEETVETSVGGLYTVEAKDEDEAREIGKEQFADEFGFDAYADYVDAYKEDE